MKKTILSLACMLIGSFAFANVNETNSSTDVAELVAQHQELSHLNLEASNFDVFVVEENAFFKECHVKIKGTINGQKIDVDVTFTSDSGSCIKDTVKLLQEVAAEK